MTQYENKISEQVNLREMKARYFSGNLFNLFVDTTNGDIGKIADFSWPTNVVTFYPALSYADCVDLNKRSLTHDSLSSLLTPLSKITDEDAIDVAKIVMRRHDRHYNKVDYTIHDRSTKEFFYIEVLVRAENTHRGYLVRIESTDVYISDEIIKSGDNYTDRGKDYSTTNSFHAYQYLQQLGYALPFMEYSVDKLVELGWVKLK